MGTAVQVADSRSWGDFVFVKLTINSLEIGRTDAGPFSVAVIIGVDETG